MIVGTRGFPAPGYPGSGDSGLRRVVWSYYQISRVLSRNSWIAGKARCENGAIIQDKDRPMMSARRYWLMKSEPHVYSIQDLKRDKVTCWDGVWNYQARNFLRDEIQVGDGVLFYHSNAEPSGIAGLAKVVRAGYPDFTAFDPKDPHYDPKSDPAKPTWYMVDVAFIQAFTRVISLDVLRKTPGLEQMALFRYGRLSVQPATPREWSIILRLAEHLIQTTPSRKPSQKR